MLKVLKVFLILFLTEGLTEGFDSCLQAQKRWTHL